MQTMSRKALAEALTLAEETLTDIELTRIPLSAVMLKASRLARLLSDDDYRLAFECEASGYSTGAKLLPPDRFEAARLAGRVVVETEEGKEVEKAYTDAISTLEERIVTSRLAIEAARDPDVAISSSNPSQYVWSPAGNTKERTSLRNVIRTDSALVARSRGFVHGYVSRKYQELRFSGIADDIFSRLRTSVDDAIGDAVPKSVEKFASIYENLASDNPEDWANAVHSCRRILQDLADVLFPPQADRVVEINGKTKSIKLGVDNYINRLVAFVEDNAASERFEAIVGSNLSFLGDRLDAAFEAAQKGSHAQIATRSEADRYVVYTYMLVADLLSLVTH